MIKELNALIQSINALVPAANGYMQEYGRIRNQLVELQAQNYWQHKATGDQLIRKDMRYIALLETRPGLVTKYYPPYSYIEETNGTLGQEECILRVDQDGFRVSERPYHEGDAKIMLLGSSPLDGSYIPEASRIPVRLEDILVEQGKKAKIYNAGASYSHCVHMLNLLMNKGIPLRPQCLVFYIAVRDDVRANGFEDTFWANHTEMTPIRKPSQDALSDAPHMLENVNNFDDQRRLLRSLADICRNFDIRLFIATWPIYGGYDNFMRTKRANVEVATFEREWAQARLLNALIRDVCREKECGLIDLAEKFEGLDHHEYFYDEYHPNVKGSRHIAALTAEALAGFL